MKIPNQEVIEAVISELDSDDCDKKAKHVCETCEFTRAMADLSSEDEPSCFDKFLLEAVSRSVERDLGVAMGITLGGSGMVALIRMVGFHSFLIGYKTRCNEQRANELHDLMNKD